MKKQTKAFWASMVACLILILPTFAQVEQSEIPHSKDEAHEVPDSKSGEEGAKPARKYVEISIRGPLAEVKPAFMFGPTVKTLRSFTTQIDKIREDDEVAGVLLKIEAFDAGWAKLQEMRDKIIQLRKAGKQVVGYLEGGGNAEYLLACATDRIVLMPTGTIGLTGLRAEVMFYQGLFEKLGIKADMLAIGKYKSAIEPYTRDSMSDAQREAMNAILDDLYEQQIQMIADGRSGIDTTTAAELIDRGPFTATEAYEAKLVDALQYDDELVKSIEANPEEPIEIVSASDKKSEELPELTGFAGFIKFLSMLTAPKKSSTQSDTPRMALIYATGPILPDTPRGAFTAGQIITPHELTEALRKAREDSSIRAVVMRVESPGGSALASDLIWREVMLTQRKKPVVVSMSDVAGSGGYYIAMAAGTIVAEPGTITGSIGVLGGKLNLKGLYNKIGLTKEILTRGKNATLYSDYAEFTPTERERVEKMMETIYQDFVRKAAAGRGKTEAEIREVAQGRIWTGKQAKNMGLVDELGGLDTAFAIAKKQIGLSADDEVDIIVLPKPKTFFETLIEDMDTDIRLPITPHLSIPASLVQSLSNFYWLHLFANEPVTAVLPFEVTIR